LHPIGPSKVALRMLRSTIAVSFDSSPPPSGRAPTARTQRETLACAGLQQGPAAEKAWRQRHKWAARRVAHLMTDLYERPPLAPLADAVDAVAIGVGLSVDGVAIDGTAAPGAWVARSGLLNCGDVPPVF
jgi:hypothetical protein